MKKIILIIIWTIFWLSIESTLTADFPVSSVRLDLVFLAVLSIGFIYEFREGIAPVVMIGMIADAVSNAPFGILTAVYTAAFAAVRFAASTIYVNSATGRFVWTTAASVIALWLKALLVSLIFKNPYFIIINLWRFIPQAVFNGLLGMMFIPFFRWYLDLSWEKITRPKGLVLK